jgi:hypothetical protein
MPIIQNGNANPDRINVEGSELGKVYKGSYLVWQKPKTDDPDVEPECYYDCALFTAKSPVNHYPLLDDDICLIQATSANVQNPAWDDGLVFPLGGRDLPRSERTNGYAPIAHYVSEEGEDEDTEGWTMEDAEGVTVTFWVNLFGLPHLSSRVVVGAASPDWGLNSWWYYNDLSGLYGLISGSGFGLNISYIAVVNNPVFGDWMMAGCSIYRNPVNGVWRVKNYLRGGGVHIETTYRNISGATVKPETTKGFWLGVAGAAQWERDIQCEGAKIRGLKVWDFPFVATDNCGNFVEFNCEYENSRGIYG